MLKRLWQKKIVAVGLAIPLSLMAAKLLRVPVDQSVLKQAETAAREAQQESNPAAAMRAYRRWLEFYPNEPIVQASIYRAMALAAEQAGELEQAKTWKLVAANLNPELEKRIEERHDTTRGSGDQWMAIISTASQTAAMIQEARARYALQHPKQFQPGQPVYPGAPVGTPGYPPPVANGVMPGYGAIPGQQPQTYPTSQAYPPAQPSGTYPVQPYPPATGVDLTTGQPIQQPYPPAPVQPGAQTYPPAPTVQGFDPTTGQPLPQAYPPAQPQPTYPPAQPQQAYPPAQPQQAYPPVQPQQAYPTTQTQQPYPTTQTQQPYQQGQMQPGYPPQGYPQGMIRDDYSGPQRQPGRQQIPQRYAPPSDPYRMPSGYQAPRRRGETGAPMRLLHDHSLLGDAAFFEASCGALVTVENGNLTFTPSGEEGPRVIPVSDIVEVRLNSAVGREAGAFHIVTRKGLYLHLAPESSDPEAGRADVEELRKRLGLE